MSEPAARREEPVPALPSPALLVPAAVAVFALSAVVCLVVAEFTPLFAVQVQGHVFSSVRTGAHHSYAQLVIAAAAVGLVALHLRTGRREPLIALLALGAIALLIGIVADLPDTHATGVIGQRFENAKATARGGLWLELSGGALLLAAAAIGLLLEGRDGVRASEGPQRARPSR